MSNFSALPSGYCPIEMGSLNQFIKKVAALQNNFSDRVYRFRPLDSTRRQPFWVFEEEDEDDLFGGVLQVQDGKVYAISRDVYDFVSTAFARKE